MTDQSISPDEFQRFQNQLISLKEDKYKSEEKCEFLIRNVSQLESKCLQLERDLLKANDLKNRFKSAKDMDMLMNENQILRDRLSTIEGNFKLQNDVIRTECENLFSENERLRSQMETYKTTQKLNLNPTKIEEEDDMDSPVHQDIQYKIRSLQHEVTKLLEEKSEIENENKVLESEINQLKISEEELVSRINSLLNDKTKLATQLQIITNELEVSKSTCSSALESFSRKIEEQSKTDKNEYENKLQQLESQLNDEHSKIYEDSVIKFENKIDVLEKKCKEIDIELSTKIEQLLSENEILKIENEKNISKCISNYEQKLNDKNNEIDDIRCKYQLDLDQMQLTNEKLQANLDYTQEELTVLTRKNLKKLKDVKKQLEKEVKLTQDTQSRLDEVVSTTSGSQNSQTKIQEYLVGAANAASYNNNRMPSWNSDDLSSLHSCSNNGISADCQLHPGSNNIAMTDDELKILLDRFTNLQNDFGESKRVIESLNNDKKELVKTIEKQQNIILNYIKNRGGSECDCESKLSTSSNHSTSDTLILNGILSDSGSSGFGLQSLVTKVKDSLKSLSSNDPTSPGDRSACRVTTAELKQLQRVCEELMMRCLNLETDLQHSLDINAQLQARLRVVS